MRAHLHGSALEAVDVAMSRVIVAEGRGMTYLGFDHGRGTGQDWVGASPRAVHTRLAGLVLGPVPSLPTHLVTSSRARCEDANPLVASSQVASPCHARQTLPPAAVEGRTRNA